jgi:hypothetical protein
VWFSSIIFTRRVLLLLVPPPLSIALSFRPATPDNRYRCEAIGSAFSVTVVCEPLMLAPAICGVSGRPWLIQCTVKMLLIIIMIFKTYVKHGLPGFFCDGNLPITHLRTICPPSPNQLVVLCSNTSNKE